MLPVIVIGTEQAKTVKSVKFQHLLNNPNFLCFPSSRLIGLSRLAFWANLIIVPFNSTIYLLGKSEYVIGPIVWYGHCPFEKEILGK